VNRFVDTMAWRRKQGGLRIYSKTPAKRKSRQLGRLTQKISTTFRNEEGREAGRARPNSSVRDGDGNGRLFSSFVKADR